MALSAVKLLNPRVVAQTGPACTASIIFLHGSGDTGQGIREWLQMVLGHELAFPHIRVVYPTAPARPYTPMMGHQSTVWFNRKKISPFVAEDESVIPMCEKISELIDLEIKNGIPFNRIIIGGFSMGGCAALHVGYRFRPSVAGVFGMSCFLNEKSSVYETLDTSSNLTQWPPLFMSHGKDDSLVLPEWGRVTYNELKSRGVDSELHMFDNLYHEFNKKTLHLLKSWILKHLPEES
ncbi:lysophospholipase-like protein 1 isoform X1 [Octopus bimaculoides]|uniref:palmitoyl-protein hydrolase n=2 Tax=Octopus bimaculoides TaxID=37653 RepID=A0A0L8HE97_OCTBM|nr:lysophospholipase-like protein 1 isoform X1 [Octopus bimaculoides]|eukprot:XP_014773447.1 PREDICTED: lysophospholipase-like protein 1 isoform X1 [Octopus bimaculoides]